MIVSQVHRRSLDVSRRGQISEDIVVSTFRPATLFGAHPRYVFIDVTCIGASVLFVDCIQEELR